MYVLKHKQKADSEISTVCLNGELRAGDLVISIPNTIPQLKALHDPLPCCDASNGVVRKRAYRFT